MAIKKMSKIVDLGRAWWVKLGAELVDAIFIHTTQKRLDHKGQKFKALSDNPWLDKDGDVIFEGYATRKRKGEFPSQSSTGGANLVLSGLMMTDLQPRRVTDNSVEVGWGNTESKKVIWNSDNGRTVTSKINPIAPQVEKVVQKLIDKQTKKNIKKNDTVTIIKLGK